MTEERVLQARNPRTGDLDYSFSASSAQQIAASAARAQEAQSTWQLTNVAARSEVLLQWAQQMALQRDAMVAALASDTGRVTESVLELDSIIAAIQRWATDAPALLGDKHHFESAVPGINIAQRAKPYALAGVISPWNFPLLLSLIDAIPALLAGTAVLLKPSEVTPRFLEPLQASLDAVPMLAPLLQLIPGDGATGAALLEHVDMVVFTGSVTTGKKVGLTAAQHFIPSFLELGGKDPAIVTEDVDIQRCAAALTWGSTANAGQSCLSIERVYVHQSIHDELVTALAENFSRLRLNTQDISEGEIGPVIAERQIDVLRAHLDDARSKGADIVCGGELLTHGGGTWCQPTLLTGTDAGMLVVNAESFGPLLPVMPYSTDEEAITLANSTEFGLSAAVFCADTSRAEKFAAAMDAGAVSINDCALTAIVHEGEKQSFKASGLGGSRMGPASLQRFLRRQAFLINNNQNRDPWWYPIGD